MKVHIEGPAIVDERGRRVAWLGYAKKCGTSQRVTFDEQARILSIIAKAINDAEEKP